MTRLLLVSPRFPDSFWSFRWVFDSVITERKAMNAPLGLATVAALTPAAWHVEIADEEIEELPLETDADIVGICGMGIQFERQCELVAHYKSRGAHVVVGGSYASLCPELYEGVADTVVSGEAEYTWPAFCADFEAGKAGALYREDGSVELTDSPVPRFDLLKLDRYYTVPIQFSRGCPFLCEFCDIIVMFGRKPRTKTTEQIRREFDSLRELGVDRPFFVDDNFIGDRRAARQLLAAIIEYQREHDHPFRFGTEASIDLAHDPELLGAMREADFGWVFIGLETPSTEALTRARKHQNLREDPLESVAKIHAAGIDVFAGFIVGFDSDDHEAIERLHAFVIASGIQVAILNLLSAIPKTPLYDRVAQEGRLLSEFHGHISSKLGTNVLPVSMDYDEMVEAFRQTCLSLSSDRHIADRIVTKLRVMGEPPVIHRGSIVYKLRQLGRLFFRGVVPGGPRRVYHFLRTLRVASPGIMYTIFADWTMGLAIQSYVGRHFAEPAPRLDRLDRPTAVPTPPLTASPTRTRS